MTAVFPSAASQVFPGPSGPAGHKIFSMLLNCESVEEGDASMMICAACNGMGTSDEENGVAPLEKGTLGLFVLFNEAPLPWNDATNDPAKNMLEAEECVVIESTSAAARERPPKGAFDHEPALVSHMATDEAGEVNFPPT